MSPSALTSGAPEGGLARSRTAVSSMPFAIGLMVKVVLASQLVSWVVPYSVAPVPYIMRFESNGSISTDSFIQPSFGVASGGWGLLLKSSHGSALMSIVYRLDWLG